MAQWQLEPPRREAVNALLLFVLAAGWVLYLQFRNELTLPETKPETEVEDTTPVKLIPFIFGFITLAGAFFFLRELRFTQTNLILWLGSIVLIAYSLTAIKLDLKRWAARLSEFRAQKSWSLTFTRANLVILLVVGVVLFFQTHQLQTVTPDMGSAQAENLLDTNDILKGDLAFFFPRNRGRELAHMYLTAFVASTLHVGLSFQALKIAAILETVFFLFYLYRLAEEVANRRVALLAVLLAGTAFWPLALIRTGDRYMWMAVATATVLFHLVRGLRTARRSDFVWAGLFLGLGLIAFRPAFALIPLVLLAVILFALHYHDRPHTRTALIGVMIIAIFALIIFLPVLFYWFTQPDNFNLHSPFAFELPADQPVLDFPALLFDNFRNALLMFNWNNGGFSAFSVPLRPALDVASGGLFVIGAVMLLGRYVRRRTWSDLTLLLALPIVLIPTILKLQTPNENPSPHLATGAIVLVFLFAALALESILRTLATAVQGTGGRVLATLVGLVLLGTAVLQNYSLTFEDFAVIYQDRNWNAGEVGQVIADFTNTVGDRDQAWVMRYPHWVDTRVVAMEAGYVEKDYQLGVEQLQDTLSAPTPKMFILYPEDVEGLSALETMYPTGVFALQESQFSNKDFIIFFVPADQ
jgi:hypothetical protein